MSLITAACNTSSDANLDIQGHRGARGLLPENSIPSFKKALDLGVKTLELDVVISKDNQVIISHEPFMSAGICFDSEGKKIAANRELEFNIYEMDYAQIRKFDCGTQGNSRFPEQQKQPVHKPLLSEMIREMESYAELNKLAKPNYNIELKSEPEWDDAYHPQPAPFSDLVYNVIQDKISRERVNIQSFDKRILQYWRQAYPDYKLAYLVEEAITPDRMKEELGFLAEIYSPYFESLTEDLIKDYHDLNIKVIPWTINEVEDMKRLISWQVDGIITDYPDRAIGLGDKK
jgi:glycerophosphoryl diester phosphodiesterase